jgi:hypothetical protein
MFASELMELIRKNPEKHEGKRYKVTVGDRLFAGGTPHGYKECIVKNSEICSNDNASFALCIFSNTEVEEIKQPVTWQEAIEAWANGKSVKCVYGDKPRVGIALYNNGGFLKDTDSCSLSKAEIVEGIWYIED